MLDKTPTRISTISSNETCEQVAGSSTTYTSPDHNDYNTTCGYDHYKNDISSSKVAEFTDCIPICDGLVKCASFSYLPASQYCHFKSAPRNKGDHGGHSDFTELMVSSPNSGVVNFCSSRCTATSLMTAMAISTTQPVLTDSWSHPCLT